MVHFTKIGNFYVLKVFYSHKSKIFLIIGPDYPGIFAVLTIFTLSFALALVLFKEFIKRSILFVLFVVNVSVYIIIAVSDPGILKYCRKLDDIADSLLTYCDLCDSIKSTEFVHCFICNCCILNRSHHCSWVGKCVGQKNMIFFQIFNLCWISYLVIYLCFIIAR